MSAVEPHISRRFSDLSEAAKALVSTMDTVQFGRFEGLRICNGDVVFDPPPRLVRVTRIGSAKDAPAADSSDWLLNEPIVTLLQEFAALGNGTVERLEFRHGLPVLLETAIPARPESSSDVSRGS